MVIDREGIVTRLRRLGNSVAELRDLCPATLEEYVGNRRLQRNCERELQIAIQCVLDIGSHIIAEETLESPEELKDIFAVLGSSNILPQAFASRLEPMAGFRNILVHDYLRIDHAKVYAALTRGLDDLLEFARYVQAWLDRKAEA